MVVTEALQAEPDLLEDRQGCDEWTPLQAAAMTGNDDVAKYLLSLGADIEADDCVCLFVCHHQVSFFFSSFLSNNISVWDDCTDAGSKRWLCLNCDHSGEWWSLSRKEV